MNKHIQWLKNELERWVNDGLIEEHHAELIRQRYPAAAEGLSWGSMTLGVIGSILLGLGVILFFAFNWHEMSKYAKLGVIFTALIASHGAAIAVNRKVASEVLHVLGTMIFGAGIWLVAQIYHIEEHFTNGILVWGLAALVLAWVLPSIPQMLLAVLLLVTWHGFEALQFRAPLYLAPALFAVGVLPLALWLRSRVLTAAGIIAFLTSMIFMHHVRFMIMDLRMALSVGAAFVAAGIILARSKSASQLAPVFFFFGMPMTYTVLLVLTFSSASRDLNDSYHAQQIAIWYLAVSALAVGLWIAALRPFATLKERLGAGYQYDYLVIPAALLITLLAGMRVINTWGPLPHLLFNLLFLASIALIMIRGFMTQRRGLAVAGSVLLSFYTLARYLDLFQSLLARSMAFMLTGAAVIAAGFLISYARKGPKEVKA